MLSYIFKRLLALIPVGLGVLWIVCFLIHVIPGDPVDTILGEYATSEEKLLLKKQLGLDQSLLEQYLHYVGAVVKGDLGQSLIYKRPVAALLWERCLPTCELAFLAVLLASLLSLPLGVLAALFRGTIVDFLAMGFSMLGVVVPNFWLGPLLILFFSLKLGWLPVSERAGPLSYVLPTCTLALGLSAFLSRITRSAVLDVLQEDYIRTARAKGQHLWGILWGHVLKNASIPIVTVLSLQFGVLLTGAVISEMIFDWPGLGTLMLGALGNRDYPLLQGCVLCFACSYLVVNVLTDIILATLDPRIRLS